MTPQTTYCRECKRPIQSTPYATLCRHCLPAREPEPYPVTVTAALVAELATRTAVELIA